MKVTIVITCYNIKDYIGEAIESAIKQTYKDVEIVVVDDCSTDGSLDVIKEYDVKIITNARNMGVGYSKYIGAITYPNDYIIFLDGDDMFNENLVEEYMKAIGDRTDIDFVSSNVYGYIRNSLYNKVVGGYNSIMFSWDFFNRIEYSKLRYREDADIIPRIVHCAKNYIVLDEKYYIWNERYTSVTRTSNCDKENLFRLLGHIHNYKFFKDWPEMNIDDKYPQRYREDIDRALKMEDKYPEEIAEIKQFVKDYL